MEELLLMQKNNSVQVPKEKKFGQRKSLDQVKNIADLPPVKNMRGNKIKTSKIIEEDEVTEQRIESVAEQAGTEESKKSDDRKFTKSVMDVVS